MLHGECYLVCLRKYKENSSLLSPHKRKNLLNAMHRSLNRTQTYSEGCGEDTQLPGRELNPSYSPSPTTVPATHLRNST